MDNDQRRAIQEIADRLDADRIKITRMALSGTGEATAAMTLAAAALRKRLKTAPER